MRSIFAIAVVCLGSLFGALGAASAQDGPTLDEEDQRYVRICDQFGAGFFLIPGTADCIDAELPLENQERISALEQFFGPAGTLTEQLLEMEDSIDESKEGSAMGFALVNPVLPDGKNFAIGTNIGNFDGESAVGMSGVAAVTDTWGVSGGFGVGLGEGTLGGRVGFQAAW